MTPQSTPPVLSIHEARMVTDELRDAMSAMQALVEQETVFMRAGGLGQALALGAQKSAASRRYTNAVAVGRRNQPHLAALMPDAVRALVTQHDKLRAALQINMTVLATAQAVSEGVVRGANAEIQRRAMPQGYTQGGYRAAPAMRHAMPIAVSRSL